MRLRAKQRLDYVLGGICIFVLRPLAMALGTLLRRNHTPVIRGCAAVIKMLGGGSLVIALPALLGLRRKYPEMKLYLVTSRSVKPFADVLSVFDEVIVVNDETVFKLAVSGVRVLSRLFRVDTVIDFEVYSRLSTVLSTLLCARNRISFYLESTFWREYIATHLIYFNRYAGSFHFYEAAVGAVGGSPVSLIDCGLHVARQNGFEICSRRVEGRITALRNPDRICIAPSCSDLGKERMLISKQWLRLLPALIGEAKEVVVLGGPDDSEFAAIIANHGHRILPGISWVNACDGRSLRDSLKILAGSSRLITIDSSLLHFARLFGVPTFSFWGPTDPMTRLKDYHGLTEKAWYQKLPCSPCVHVAEIPPCFGENLCMEAAVRCYLNEEIDSIIKANFPPAIGRLQKS